MSVTARSSAPESEPKSRTRVVLVVEGEVLIRFALADYLRERGLKVYEAGNGEEAIQLLSFYKTEIDVVFSDVKMPGMGGVEMVKALRLDPRTSRVRIIMLTSESSAESEAEAFAAGADDYILKPIDPKRLAARVKAMFARSRPTAA